MMLLVLAALQESCVLCDKIRYIEKKIVILAQSIFIMVAASFEGMMLDEKKLVSGVAKKKLLVIAK